MARLTKEIDDKTMRSLSNKRILTLFFAFFAGFILSSCAGFKPLVGKDYPESAKLNYEEGIRYLQMENYEVAQQYFQLVRTEFTFSRYSAMSELLLADTIYFQDMFTEAVDAYRIFQRNHPKHPCVLYAQYRIGDSHFEQMPEDWWFMPPAHERDLLTTEYAYMALRRVIHMEKAEDFYYSPEYEPEEIGICDPMNYEQVRTIVYHAHEKMNLALEQLIQREVYVAQYHLKRDKPKGAVGRLEGAFKKYPFLATRLDYVRMLAESYEAAHMFKKALNTWAWIASNQKGKPAAKEAKKEIERVKKEEADWLVEEEKRKQKRAKQMAAEDKKREELGLQKIDPDPDPNAESDIPLVDPKTDFNRLNYL